MSVYRRQSLKFSDVDGLAFAAEKNRLAVRRSDFPWVVEELGPLLELFHLAANGPSSLSECLALVVPSEFAEFYASLKGRKKYWLSPNGQRTGYLRTEAKFPQDRAIRQIFGFRAHQAAIAAGFSSGVAAQLVGSILEMESNIYEHSENPTTGLLVYRMRQGIFEFVVSDLGVGVLNSLRNCNEFNYLSDYGDALRLALSEGVSRFGANAGRGMGFRQLFVGLANLNGVLRFRSGDHALVIDGENPTLMAAKTAEKPRIRGFLASIALRLPKARPRIQAHQPR